MALKLNDAFNGVKVYNCTAGRTLPQWYEDFQSKKVKSLRYDEEFRNRIDLIQDFEFPAASTRIKMSGDKRYIGATGIYKPQIKIFDTENLGLKFERHLDAEAVQFQFLAEDYGKIAIMRADRAIEIHAPYGRHHIIRIPKFGRDMTFDKISCDLVMVGAGSEAYRLNLDEGRFMTPLQTGMPSINAVGINPTHQLLAMAGADGKVEFWDPRDSTRAARLDVVASAGLANAALGAKLNAKGAEATAVRFDDDGLGVAVGTSTGQVLLFDLRSSKPVLWKDHRYGLPIVDLKYHPTSKKVISSDSKIIKMWDKVSGEAFTSIEPTAAISDICVDEGIVMVAGEQHRIQAFYVPEMGSAPKWASFLDSLTEELEEQADKPLYDDYKFVTREQLEDWGLTHLVGSNLLRAYMHGFFMDLRLYNRVRSASDPMAYEQYIKRQVRTTIDKKRENRITVSNKLPAVNKGLAQVLLKQPGRQAELMKGGEEVFKNPLGDDRFKSLFQSKDFEIDVESAEFRRLNPNRANHRLKNVKEESENEDNSDDEEESDSEEELVYRKNGKGSSLLMGSLENKGEEQAAGEEEEEEVETDLGALFPSKRKKPAMYELKQGLDLSSLSKRSTGEEELAVQKKKAKLSLQDRLKMQDDAARLLGRSAEAEKAKQGEFSFVPTVEVKGRGVVIPHDERRETVVLPEGMKTKKGASRFKSKGASRSKKKKSKSRRK